MENKSGKCTSGKYRIAPGGWASCDGCSHDEGLKDRYEPMTNADRIRNMTDEELAEYLGNIHYCPAPYPTCDLTKECKECWLKWLRSPVEESEGEK